MLIRPPRFIQRLYPSIIWNIPQEKEGVFLTFDDGPCPQITPWILDQLDLYKAKATFFCLGKNVEMYPDLYQEMIKRGHVVANHSYSHLKGWHTDEEMYLEDIDAANDLIHSHLFRPPYAKITPHQVRIVNERYKVVLWSILSRDYNRKLSCKQCLKNVLPYLFPGEIIVFHDSIKASKNLWYVLPEVLKEGTKKKLSFKSIQL